MPTQGLGVRNGGSRGLSLLTAPRAIRSSQTTPPIHVGEGHNCVCDRLP